MRKNRLGLTLWLTAAVTLCFFENNTASRTLLIASVALPLLSVLCAVLTARRMSVRLTVPAECTAGQETEVTVTLSAPRAALFCAVHLCPSLRNRMTGETASFPMNSPAAKTALRFTPLHCGMHSAADDGPFVTDWFGLIRRKCAPADEQSFPVMPVLYPVSVTLSQEAAQPVNDSIRFRPGLGDPEADGVREYRPGDTVRAIHWKLTEKLDRAMIRQSELPQDSRILLLLDRHIEPDTGSDAQHELVRAFLSAAQSFCAMGLPFLAVTAGIGGELLLTGVSGEQDLPALTLAALYTEFSPDAECTGALFASMYPGQTASRTILFSADARTDAVSLWQGYPITLVCPHEIGQMNAIP